METATNVAPPTAADGFSGRVHGGQQPVANATIQLYATGSSGNGSAGTALIKTVVTTDNNGNFSLPTYTCPSSGQVYLVATGGNPGLSPSTSANAQLSMMAALGSCSALTSNTFILVNELTTVAAVSALSGYMTSYSAIGASSGTSSQTALANAFALANELVNTSTGTAPGKTVPSGYSAPTGTMYALADLLAACVNSLGGTAGDTTACGKLFTAATPSGGAAPTETIGAMLDIALNPNQNVTALFQLVTGGSPFEPALTSAPPDWTLPILANGAVRILFVGDSFTHGRYLPVRTYNATNMTDENYGLPSSNARAESSTEPGPYGGIPGIFKELTTEAGLSYDVHIEAISSTSLQNNYADASAVIANTAWNAVVLQEVSDRPIPESLSGDSTSNPSNFCSSVQTIEQGLHTVNTNANVYLYATWARADEAEALATGGTTYATGLSELFASYHNVYFQAAANDGKVAGVAPAGDAWQLAMSDGYATADPYTSSTGPFLWFLYQAGSNPATTSSSPDYLHPSIYGAYLDALVLFEQITGQNATTLGSGEAAAAALGISGTIATELQGVAHEQVSGGSRTYSGNPCSVT